MVKEGTQWSGPRRQHLKSQHCRDGVVLVVSRGTFADEGR